MKKMSFFIIIFFYLNLSSTEKIYSIMITGKDPYHKKLAEKSIESFATQTYPNKYLIIVNDGDYSFDNLNKELFKEIKLKEKFVLGKLRNIGLSYIPENAIYLQWDDDDWHHPKLMQEQYNQLISTKADVCLLKKQVQHVFSINTSWKLNVNKGIMGTIMCRKKNNILYPLIPKAEDKYFLDKYLKSKCKITVFDNPEYYYLRFVHGHNTWDANHFLQHLKYVNQNLISEDAKKYLLKILDLYNFVPTTRMIFFNF